LIINDYITFIYDIIGNRSISSIGGEIEGEEGTKKQRSNKATKQRKNDDKEEGAEEDE